MGRADQLYEQQYATLCADQNLGQTLAALADYRRRPPYWWIGGQAALGHGILLRAYRMLKRLRWRLGAKHE